MFNLTKTPNGFLQLLNGLIICTSVWLCSVLVLLHLPGMELLEVSPNWFLIWLVAWSVKRQVWQAATAGLALGLIYDGMTTSEPSHILSFILVSVLTTKLNKQRYIGEDFISVALIVFFMAIMAETVLAIQSIWQSTLSFGVIWQNYRRIAIISAVLSSLWAPALYFPLERWWEFVRQQERL
ncbi:MAG: rod shape-determining protein MreD [Stanieria sp.]